MQKSINLSKFDITPQIKNGVNIINAYSDSYFIVNGTKFDHSIILNEKSCVKFTDFTDIENYLKQDNQIIILYGTNCEERQADFRLFIHEKSVISQVSFEIMTMQSAARTYNILIAEERNVLAVLELS